MAGETIKTRGIVLDIRPWSRTSHVVTWLTPEAGPVATLVKGAVRPKSAFLGQYDFFYTCELVYYARSRGELHAIREASPIAFRENLRQNWRAVTLMSYAAQLMKEHCPHNSEAEEWYNLFEETLKDAGEIGNHDSFEFGRRTVRFELKFLHLAGLEPDFSAADFSAAETPFSIDSGHVGSGGRLVLLSSPVASYLSGRSAPADQDTVKSALRFLGLFLRYHLGISPETRRNVLQLILSKSV
jgi:DNA repair protein RecO